MWAENRADCRPGPFRLQAVISKYESASSLDAFSWHATLSLLFRGFQAIACRDKPGVYGRIPALPVDWAHTLTTWYHAAYAVHTGTCPGPAWEQRSAAWRAVRDQGHY